eukprot:TRINITY_DN3262_c0_g1_i1.p1 TRINITY_DN3262_c0_g1~~TRINITY_DN3262_c0_g1_i1.p1  ORF type:complete len:168 (+),score=27.12 TRINITY_DN3262_c0_g1_i1:246-749(+)
MEFLERNFTSMVKDERSKFGELNLFVSIRVNSEHIPENVVELSFSGLIQNFNGELFQFFIVKVTLLRLIVFVEVSFEFIPNGIDKSKLFFRYSSRVLIFFLSQSPRINTVSEIFSDEVNKLLESNETVFISIKFSENEFKIFSGRFVLDEVAPFSDKSNEFFKGNFL